MSRTSETGMEQQTQAQPQSQQTPGGATERIRQTASHLQQDLREMGSEVRDVASEKLDELRQTASEYYQQGRQRAQEWERGLERYVQEKPIQSLLIAAGVGMLLGILWRRS